MAKKSVEQEANEMTAAAPAQPDFEPDWNPDEFERASSEIWRPDEGEYIMGTYDGQKILDKELTEFDEDVCVHFVIDHESGNRYSFVGGKMADKWIQEAGIKEGYKVFVRFMGQGSTRKGNKVNNYDIRFKRA